MQIDQIVKEYEIEKPILDQFKIKLHDLIADLLNDEKIQYQIIESRTKDVDSFKNKIQREGKSYKDPINEITDLVGLRIILYYLSDVIKVSRIINSEFKVIPEHSFDKINLLEPNEFGYLSLHQVIKIKQPRAKLSEWKKFEEIYAEIQIRTVLQHAWASISHALLYKRESEVPKKMKRKLNRLSSLLELTDEQFQELKFEQEKTSKEIDISVSNKKLDIDININSIKSFFSNFELNKTLMEILEKYDRYIFTSANDREDYSLIVQLSEQMGIELLEDLKKILESKIEYADSFFSFFYKPEASMSLGTVSGSITHFWAVILVGIIKLDYPEFRLKIWGEEYWKNIDDANKKISQ